MDIKERLFELSFTCGMTGIDYDNMEFKDYTSLELHNMRTQMHNAILDINSELRQRGYASERL